VGARGRGEELQALTLCRAFFGETKEMKQRLRWEVIAILFLFVSFSWPGLVGATEIRISPLTAHPGQTVDVPITIDEVDNLAGVKLVMSYDQEILVFKKGAKTKQTDSLMHVVNDKKPGQIIVVMAGARGIKGKNIPIFTLSFDVKSSIKGNHKIKIAITEAQLMSDQLKEIKCNIVIDPITISP
jgi:hypothetical protein